MPKFAGRIVKQFGADTLNVIEEDPDRLLEVTGMQIRKLLNL